MQLHQIQPTHKPHPGKRVGRGGKKGTFSGRGVKGQKSRSGARFQPMIRELIKRYPKLRGYRVSPTKDYVILNVGDLGRHFQAGETVTPALLRERRLVDTIQGRVPEVKLLGNGKLTKALTVEGCRVSRTAKEKIESAGGSVA